MHFYKRMELRYVMYGYFITYSISVLVFCNSVVTIAGKQTNLTYQFAGAETFGDRYSNENGSVVTSNRMGLPDNPLKISTLLKQPPQFLFPLSYIDRRFASQRQELTLPDIISRVTYLNSLYNLRPKNTLPPAHYQEELLHPFGNKLVYLKRYDTFPSKNSAATQLNRPFSLVAPSYNLASKSYRAMVENERYSFSTGEGLVRYPLNSGAVAGSAKNKNGLGSKIVFGNGLYSGIAANIYGSSFLQRSFDTLRSGRTVLDTIQNPSSNKINNVVLKQADAKTWTNYNLSAKPFFDNLESDRKKHDYKKYRFLNEKASLKSESIPDGVASSDASDHGGLMSPIKHHNKPNIANVYTPPFDSVVNMPAIYSSQNIGGRTEFTNPVSNPHSFGIPFTPIGDHSTWPGPAVGFEPRIPSIAPVNPERSDYGSSSNPHFGLENMRPMTSTSISSSKEVGNSFATKKVNANGMPMPRFKSQQIRFSPTRLKFASRSNGMTHGGPLATGFYRFAESGRKGHEALSAAARAAAFQMAEVKSGLFMGNGVRAPPDAFRMVQTPYGRRLGFSPIASFHRFASVSTHYPPQNHGLGAMAVDTVYPPTSPPPPGKLPHYHSHYL